MKYPSHGKLRMWGGIFKTEHLEVSGHVDATPQDLISINNQQLKHLNQTSFLDFPQRSGKLKDFCCFMSQLHSQAQIGDTAHQARTTTATGVQGSMSKFLLPLELWDGSSQQLIPKLSHVVTLPSIQYLST